MGRLNLSKNHFLYLKYKQKVKWIFEDRFRKQLFEYNFGKDIAERLVDLRSDRKSYLEGCYDFLNQDFQGFIDSYKTKFESVQTVVEKNTPLYVWICWMQGEEKMPDIVKLCIRSIKKNMPKRAKIVVLTAKTIEDYVTFPDFIVKKVRSGAITLTHFSDLLRFELLRKYGGLWIDSTCFFSANMPERLVNKPLYTIQAPQDEGNQMNDFYGRITSFIIGGRYSTTGSLFFDFCIEFFYEYHRRYNVLIDWHLINIVYALAYRNFKEVKAMVDDVGVNNADVHELNNHADDSYYSYRNLLSNENQFIHKMNWRKDYLENTESGAETVFAVMRKQLGE